ncbi:chloroplast envelope protein translocase family [Micromonas pusilla CCMP1545]|uniref:Chloroplast envelope protein translocase family n=2 Tax=Micromonas pusilla TaxID=38833 RepID=C1N6P1_MICPC|nr:chloroplast envelope protein translocase family [Micromonas pusilla CCMP1545]EEH51959.1 chloroplast envelope protein translocase family [Micromonas pusilla CCMP1545]|eukprot:XP_003063586.1 chloroplast envelope protein translocase family [Micromonas pusilla CCMP1545]
MTDSTDDEEYEYDETGSTSEQYSDDYGNDLSSASDASERDDASSDSGDAPVGSSSAARPPPPPAAARPPHQAASPTRLQATAPPYRPPGARPIAMSSSDEDETNSSYAPPPAAAPTPPAAPTPAAAPPAAPTPAAAPPAAPTPVAAAAAASGGAVVAASSVVPPPPEEEEPAIDPDDKDAKMTADLQKLRVNLLRIATRFGQSPRNTVVAQVIYRLELAEQLKSGKKAAGAGMGRGQTSSFDKAVLAAEAAERREGVDSDLGFTCTILLLGKSGVGKSSTINSLLGRDSATASAFDAETKSVRVIEHKMHGMTLRLIDTPGLQPSASDIQYNSRIMGEAKRFTKKHKPDIVLYFDRMDQPARTDAADLPLLKTITSTFGAAVWFNAIVVLTHGSSAPPDGQNGQPISYEMYFAQRSHVVQQIIRQAAGDPRLMNPVALAENHPMCRTNREGERVLPNGQVWMPQLLLLCFASKILTEANALLNLQEQNAKAAKAAAQQQKVPPLPFLLSSLITSRKPLKLEGGDDEDYDEAEDVILGAPSPYDVPKDQQEELIPPKQVAVPAPDPALPPSFDGDNPSHRYRFLEPQSQWMVRPIVEAHGWDHESGIEGFSVDKGFVLRNSIPGQMSGQLTKDKKDSNVGFEGQISIPHTKKLVTTTGVDIQTVGKQLAYTARGETRWKFCAVNKIAAGLSASIVGGALALGTKLENRWKVTPGAKLIVSAGAVSANKDVAYGGNCEAQIKHSDDPSNPNSSTVGMSFMNWRGDVALGGNAMSSVTLGKDTQLTARANLNSRGAGQLTLRATTNERLQLAGLGLVPLLCALIGRVRGD